MTDQRGLPRPDAGEAFCDIGSYEFQDFAGDPGKANCMGRSMSAVSLSVPQFESRCVDTGFPERERTAECDKGVLRSMKRWPLTASSDRTESVYQQYDIVAECDLTDGVARYAARLGSENSHGGAHLSNKR
jgi:hypothetical protein